jgi:hypothetical protein
MTVSDSEQNVSREEWVEHVDRYAGFERLILFSVLHVALALACLALAFEGHIPFLAFLCFVGGSVAIIVTLALYRH